METHLPPLSAAEPEPTQFDPQSPNSNPSSLPPYIHRHFPVFPPHHPQSGFPGAPHFPVHDPMFQTSHAHDNFLLDSPYLHHLIQQLTEAEGQFVHPRHGSPGSIPASESAVESIPTIQITAALLGSDLLVCAVCKDQFAVDAEARQLPCSHIFHSDCIIPWLSRRNSCPVCRFHFPIDGNSRERSTRGAGPVRVEDDNLTAFENTWRHISSSPMLGMSVRSQRNGFDLSMSPTQLAESEMGFSGPTSSVETVSSCPIEGIISSGGPRDERGQFNV